MKIKKILISFLIIVLMLLSTFNSAAVEQVVEQFKYTPSSFRIGMVSYSLEYFSLYDYTGNSSVEIPFTKFATVFSMDRGSYRYYVDYNITDDLSIYSGKKYILLETTVALNSYLTNNSQSYFYFYSHEGDIEQAQIQLQRETEIITVEFQGTDLQVYSNYCLLEIDDIEYFANNVGRVSYNQYFETAGVVNQAFFMTDLSIKVFDDIESVVDDIASTTKTIQEQNKVIIKNQEKMFEKLEQIYNKNIDSDDRDKHNSAVDDFNSKQDELNSIENSWKDEIDDAFNNVNSELDEFNSNIKDKIDHIWGSNFYFQRLIDYLWTNPFVSLCFPILFVFWIVYILVYRG